MVRARWSPLTPVSLRSPSRWAGLKSTVYYARSMEVHTTVTTHVTAIASIRMALLSINFGAQVNPT